ncbi:hypothetical protein FDP41_005637 [Naegleria fowleri]|uniref:Uncharacterized protein n=1 Tax=Naegleria fowleri TaxID=5763 RepID=A0A6A5BCK1_NAEFO|nr:uncharacterized protein FDP41_005637 [Naegleria fowleri]KAF0975643.1 hypothetical protein FDP41_005637 [Naegleria fowleri]
MNSGFNPSSSRMMSSKLSMSSPPLHSEVHPSPIRPLPQQQQPLHVISPVSSSYQGLGSKPLVLNPITPNSTLSPSSSSLPFHSTNHSNPLNHHPTSHSLEAKPNTPSSSFGKFINFSQLSTKKQMSGLPLSQSHNSSLNNSLSNFQDRHNNNLFEESTSRMSSQTPELFSSRHDDNDHHEDHEDHSASFEQSLPSPKASSTGSLVKSKLKFSELGSKISAIDESMMQQEKVRKKRQQQIQGLEQKIDITNSNLSQVENRTTSLESALEKVETLIYQEQGKRDLSEKNIISFVEEKFNQLAIKITQEREQRIMEDESNRKRLKSLEESVAAINLTLDSLSQEISSQQSQLDLLASNFNSFTNQYKQDRKQLLDQKQAESKEIQLQFTDTKQKISFLESEMHKQDTIITNQLNMYIHDLSQELSRLRTEVDNKAKISVEPMIAQIQQLFSTIDSNKTQLTLQIGNLQQQLAAQKSEIITDHMNPKFEKLEKTIVHNDKTHTKHVFDLKVDIEKKNEMLESTITKLQEMLSHEESQRLESETNLLQLLSKTMKRIQNGISV